MALEFDIFSKMSQSLDAASLVEVRCMIAGEFSLSDFEFDDDQLAISFINDIDNQNDKEALEEEWGQAITMAKEQFCGDVIAGISARHQVLGDQYPFEFKDDDLFLVRKPLKNISPIGWCYIWLVIYKSIATKLVILEDKEVKKFNRLFARVFEIICCFVLAGRENGPIWYLGKSRSIYKFLNQLQKIASHFHNTKVKDYGVLAENQKHRNDAGVDVLSMRAFDGEILKGDSEIVLLGATIQKTALRNKVVGRDQVLEFKNFFLPNPPYLMRGALAVPHDHDDNTQQTCADRDCIYLHFEDIIRHLARGGEVVNGMGLIEKMEARIRAFSRIYTPHLNIVA